MCGILGFSGNFRKSSLQSGLQAIIHRGPDGSGILVNKSGEVGLAHCRLAIQDLSDLGNQPMVSDNGKVTIVFNGEIFNFKELREELIDQGLEFKSNSDTEVLLNLYLTRGITMLEQLNGIFSIGLYDESRDVLFLARDRFGVKPLYYSETSNGIAFSSEIKGLLWLTGKNQNLDYTSLHRYLTYLWCPGEGTPISNIKKVRPGETICIKSGEIISRKIWFELPIFRRNAIKISVQDAIKGTKLHLQKAVERQMISDVPVGAFLSGGLDSSAVVALARQIDPTIQCFSIETLGGVEASVTDDLPYACRVADYLGVQLNVVSVEAKNIAYDILNLIPKLDEPLGDPAAFNVYYICKLAKEQGMSVLLSGAGGDDIFTGYRRHKAINLDQYLKWIPSPVKTLSEKLSLKLDQRNPYLRKISKFMDGLSLSEDERTTNYFKWIKRKDLLNLMNVEFFENELNAPFIDFLSPLSGLSKKPLDKMLALEQRFFLADHNLNYTDKMSMASGVEVRVPFLDNDLVEFAHSLPLEIKQRKGVGKWILKKSMEGSLPTEVIYRNKTGFGAPIRRWIRFELRELLMDVLSVQNIKKRGIFNAQAVHKLIKLNQDGKIDAAYTIFSILCIEIWLCTYVDKGIITKNGQLLT